MSKISFYRTEFIDQIPRQLEEGVLYVSEPFSFSAHLCACGCGSKVDTPIGPTDWKLSVHNDVVSLYPSIGNWSFACRSHYFIERGKVKWASQMSKKQIERGRAHDLEAQRQYYKSQQSRSWWTRIKSWLNK